jgi:hypothetical protein
MSLGTEVWRGQADELAGGDDLGLLPEPQKMPTFPVIR